jgi:hypothetical protein
LIGHSPLYKTKTSRADNLFIQSRKPKLLTDLREDGHPRTVDVVLMVHSLLSN